MKQYDKYEYPKQYRDIAEEYIAYKHMLGFKYSYHEQERVNSMLRYIYTNSTSTPILSLAPELVNVYAAKHDNEKPRTTHARQSHIRQFALFLKLQGIKAYVYPKTLIKVTKDFTPYIFTSEEITSILHAADMIAPNKNKFVNTPYVYPAVIRVLYGCGTRIGETLSLLRSDVDLDNGIITIHKGKNNVSRLLPMSDSLRDYLLRYEQRVQRCNNPYFFPALHNGHYSAVTIRSKFIDLLKQAGIGILPSGKYPRVHDVRHTFCVHSLEQSIAKGMDPYCSLPALSTYLGHKGIESTEIYLRLTKQYFINVLNYSANDADRIFPEVNA
jgi:integrase